MPTTSKVIIATVVKDSFGSAQSEHVLVNTTGLRAAVETTFGTGISSATTFASPPKARYMTIVMPSTNTNPWRLAGSTAETGIAMSSAGASVLCLPESSLGTTFYAYTSSTRAISGVRIIFS